MREIEGKNNNYEEIYEDEIFLTGYNTDSSVRKRKIEVMKGFDTPESSTEENESETDNESLSGEFTFHNPDEQDYHSIKNLLVNAEYGKIKNFDLYRFVDIICNQGNIGTTVKISDNLIGISTILNIRQYKIVMEHLLKYLEDKIIKKHGNPQFEKLFKSIIYKKNVGLMINERFANIPDEVVPVLRNCLLEDIEWTNNNLSTLVPIEEREFYVWDYILIFTHRFILKKDNNETFAMYPKYEEEFIVQNSRCMITWPGEKTQWCGTGKKEETKLMNEEYVLAILDFECFKRVSL
ncbi:hypothetical protein ACR3K2_03830 [Cryptosporidium serpentis]